jgi:hypothetical protein
MQQLKRILKRVPGLRPAALFMRNRRAMQALRNKTPEEIFTEICRENKWGLGDSISGSGSDLVQTSVVRSELQTLFQDIGVHTMLDIPCGDFHWMKHVNLDGIEYTGADIVADLIQRNKRFETENIHFRRINLIEDEIPKVDLVFCRDCLVHLSYQDAQIAVRNICNSGSTYLLTTTFTHRQRNRNIATGQWREINLELGPFSFPGPLKIINEECSEGEEYKDKSLGLWKVDDIRKCVSIHFD